MLILVICKKILRYKAKDPQKRRSFVAYCVSLLQNGNYLIVSGNYLIVATHLCAVTIILFSKYYGNTGVIERESQLYPF